MSPLANSIRAHTAWGSRRSRSKEAPRSAVATTATNSTRPTIHRYTNQAQVGLKVPDHLYSGCRGQMNDGSGLGWSDILGGGGDLPRNDAPLWMAFA